MLITSPANATLKQIRKLRDRKERGQSGLFYLEGLRIVTEAVQCGASIEKIIVAPELLESSFGKELVGNQRANGIEILEVSAAAFESISLKEGPQGLAAVGRQSWSRLSEIHAQPGELWVALDAVADPGNLGTIMRTADAVGAKGIILLDQSTDPYDPTAIRASMGAIFTQKLVKAAFDDFSSWKKESGIPLIGTSDSAQVDYHTVKYPANMVLFMGSERQGLHPRALELCDAMVRIPMVGRSDTLNLAVATAVVLYEIFNQKREGLPK